MTDHPRPETGCDFNRFARLVHLMRRAQVEYFRTRSGPALSQSRDLERRVDIALGWVLGESVYGVANVVLPPRLPGLDADGDDEPTTGAYGQVSFTGRRIPLRRRRP